MRFDARCRHLQATLIVADFNNLCFRVENETTLISAKNRINLSSISEVRSYITEWPRFGATLYFFYYQSLPQCPLRRFQSSHYCDTVAKESSAEPLYVGITQSHLHHGFVARVTITVRSVRVRYFTEYFMLSRNGSV